MTHYFIITAGPTSSGKLQLQRATFQYLEHRLPKYKSFLIDDLVEQDPRYKQRVNQILASSPRADLTRPSSTLLRAFQEAYFEVRTTGPCHGEAKTCDELNDSQLKEAIDNKENIVLEITGSHIPTWLLDIVPLDYFLVLSYSIVSFDILIERNQLRAKKQLEYYQQDQIHHPAPRVVDVRRDVFRNVVNQIIQNLLFIRKHCFSSYVNTHVNNYVNSYVNQHQITSASCVSQDGSRFFDQLLLFDHSSPNMYLIYDQNRDYNLPFDAFESLVRDHFKI